MGDGFSPSYDPQARIWPAKIDDDEVKIWGNSQINEHLFDRWSVVHAASGVYLGWHGMGLIPLLVVHTFFEWFENAYLKGNYPNAFPNPTMDTGWNSWGDTIAVLAGWALNLNDDVIKDFWWGMPQFTSGWRELIGGHDS